MACSSLGLYCFRRQEILHGFKIYSFESNLYICLKIIYIYIYIRRYFWHIVKN